MDINPVPFCVIWPSCLFMQLLQKRLNTRLEYQPQGAKDAKVWEVG